jgi:hypothetical protein
MSVNSVTRGGDFPRLSRNGLGIISCCMKINEFENCGPAGCCGFWNRAAAGPAAGGLSLNVFVMRQSRRGRH